MPISARRGRWAAIGFAIACSPMVALGAYGLYADIQYAATLPPNTPRCGNSALAAVLLIFPVSPIVGLIGAGLGFISASVRNAVLSNGGPQELEENR
ncbi:hypothetical protein LOC67_22760 [Stieleria sp. JC731]|uniref:hypothetical protein n=1 Tax=Stieleria sp. JC731 TaxID=2894195 RepID=UPI001E30D471|nr:hypothetical protein [Stieleria sp. JC731]MCC9603381.1 hypothetical protein [Stieleria sp. JC731]